MFNQESGDLLSRMLAALRFLPAGAVLATGPQIDPAELGAPPPGVRVERFVDQAMLLPRCALAVCHAGSGTVAASLAAGVPLLLLPMGADQPDNAARCVALGVAEALDPLAATQGALHQAMQRLLRSAPHRAAARRLAAGFAALPGQETALARLEALARRAA
ncbi:glycosyltransferase [Pseudoroseomonas cervicalis]|uniref:glycosyltransferase n=1 Tax=Teichococcus cervicalis TaxID=204525 RepID=UPI0027838876|nr:nucleotide disphospho-sugar-binding domain-containing protein [Pseudoroseomonas cervicalis]MDQ1081110.1 UDP:flavonoid glycosyltransferase YjiC (YdhE family) [Pseudoroseomonas cervicalis]